jgi:predicted DNA-binding transcriptional regulator AlpA
MSAMADDRYVSAEQLAQIVPYSARQIRRLAEAGSFPPPVKFGERKNLWLRAEVEAWLRTKEEERAMPACWVCGSPANRVMGGKQCCSRHTQYSRHPDDPPPEPCAIGGCGAPSNRREYGLAFCASHNSYDLPPRAA